MTKKMAQGNELVMRESKLGKRKHPYIDVPLRKAHVEKLQKGKTVTMMRNGIRFSIYLSTPLAEAKTMLKEMKTFQRGLAGCIKSGKLEDIGAIYKDLGIRKNKWKCRVMKGEK